MNDDALNPMPPPVEEQSANGDGPQLVLATDVLPERLNVIPGSTKPVFPGMLFPVILAQGPLADILREQAKGGRETVTAFVLAREEPNTQDPETIIKHLYKVGTAARMVNYQEAPDGSVRAIMQGVKRLELLRVAVQQGRIVAQVAYLRDVPGEITDRVKATAMAIIGTLRELIKNNPIFSEEIRMFLNRSTWDDPGRLADFAASITSAPGEELQEILETVEVTARLDKVLFLLRKELDLNQLKEKITHQIEEKITHQQREFFLREQLKVIKQELGLEKDEKTAEAERFQARVNELQLPPVAAKVIEQELNKLRLLPPESPEYTVARNYLDWLTSLPWGISSPDHLDVARARKVLDRDHHGLKDVKDRILEFIGVSKLRGTVEGSILCLVGPPGVGKTSLGRAVAEALGRKFFRFSLGGMRDEAEIKGHRRTYIGAMPGKLIQVLRQTGTQNPVIMLDEIDKVGMSWQGDPASALLEVLDPEQNHAFLDHYLDVPFDLSKVLFIATANVPDTIPSALLDRMEVIRLSGYIMQEKLMIAKRHLVPKVMRDTGLGPADLRFTDGALKAIISGYAREAGVRALEKALRGCLRKLAARKAEGLLTTPQVITPASLDELLGRPAYPEDTLFKDRQPGVVTGLAWTPLGGTVLFVEAMAYPGKPGVKHTGQLGDVMQESVSIAMSYINAHLKEYGIAPEFLEKNSIHVHVPAGATPKDGPSAGVTMATALLSMAKRQLVPGKLAMTGELTLTGKVLPVGGIKEKVIAARRAGVTDVILPAANERDFRDIPEEVRQGLAPHFVGEYPQIYRLLFGGGLDALRKEKRVKRKE